MPDLLDALTANLNGGGNASDGLDLPDEPEEDGGGGIGNLLKPAAVAAGAKSLLSDSGDEGKAVGDIGGRRAVVINEGESGIEQIASAAASIALLGLPVGKITTAVGSKL